MSWGKHAAPVLHDLPQKASSSASGNICVKQTEDICLYVTVKNPLERIAEVEYNVPFGQKCLYPDIQYNEAGRNL